MGKRASLALLLLAEVMAMAVWFSSSAAIAGIRQQQPIGDGEAALLTSMVQIGFVAGTLGSALLSLADRLDPRRFFAASALVAAGATAALALLPPTGPLVLLARFITGMAMAGVYPVGMRIAASWAQRDLGLLIGLLVGALTLGSASPHLISALGQAEWRAVYAAAAGCAAAAALLIGFAGLGPNLTRARGVAPGKLAQAWRRRPLRLANLGYLGHMWELYAAWAWLPLFLYQALAARGVAEAGTAAAWLTFAVVATGALGAWAGGLLADRLGRTAVTIGAMAVSGACAASMGWLAAAPLVLLVPVALLWGFSVIADSAQFSASIAELAEPDAIGTLLTAQTCAGFLLTLASIQLLPVVQGLLGWPGAFTLLAIGPFAGCIAMARLRRLPEATRLAGGRR